MSGLSHLATWNPRPFTLEIDGENYSATFAAIGKAARYGGDLMVTPRARLDEPMFEICLIETFSRFGIYTCLSYAMREGMPRDRKGVRFIKDRKGQSGWRCACSVGWRDLWTPTHDGLRSPHTHLK